MLFIVINFLQLQQDYLQLFYKNKNKVKLLLYCLDIWPESIKSYIKNENSIFYRLLKRVSSYVYKNCDHIACTSEAFMDYIELEHGVSINKMIYIPQHGDSSYLKMDLKANKTDCFNFMFAGHIGIGQDIECIINAVELISRDRKFKIHLVGDGNYLTNCKQIVKEKQLDDKIIFHGRIDKTEMPKYYKMADACIITLKNITKVGLTIPGKLQTYMAAGKPIVGAIDGDASKIIRNASCGYCVNSGDSVGLANIMIKIMNSNNLDAMGNNARRYYKDHFTLEINIDSLEKLLLQLR
jgi:glycosyltransferase involved in cell wall biosynthesis